MNGTICVWGSVVEKEFFAIVVFFADSCEEILLLPGSLDNRFFLLQIGLHREIRSWKVKGVFVIYFLLHSIYRKWLRLLRGPGIRCFWSDRLARIIICYRKKIRIPRAGHLKTPPILPIHPCSPSIHQLFS